MVTDMNMKVREEVFRVLGEATWVGESVLLQTLTKKVTGTMSKEKDIPASVSIVTPDGDTDISKFEEGANLLDASAAGAFVHGLEDEYLEVHTYELFNSCWTLDFVQFPCLEDADE
jgi:integrator complex subunit 4